MRVEAGKKAIALRSEIAQSRVLAEREAEREERERMWREDQRVVWKHRARKRFHEFAVAVTQVCLDQSLYLVSNAGGNSRRRKKEPSPIKRAIGPNELTYLLEV